MVVLHRTIVLRRSALLARVTRLDGRGPSAERRTSARDRRNRPPRDPPDLLYEVASRLRTPRYPTRRIASLRPYPTAKTPWRWKWRNLGSHRGSP
jgi:hypothetical protein